jgi:hypothetical protein
LVFGSIPAAGTTVLGRAKVPVWAITTERFLHWVSLLLRELGVSHQDQFFTPPIIDFGSSVLTWIVAG